MVACTIHGNGIGFIPGAVFVWSVQKVKTVGDWTRSPRGIRYTLLHLQNSGQRQTRRPGQSRGCRSLEREPTAQADSESPYRGLGTG